MKYSKIIWNTLALVAVVSLTACGGGGGGSPTAKTVTVGAITGFGSVYVNGCEYETDSASISVDGQSGTEDDLNVGDVVEVEGPTDCITGTATSITYTDELEGVVDSNAVTGGVGTIVVMGQTVTVNDLTVFEDETSSGVTLDTLVAGNVVEISGSGIGGGDIVASRIELKAVDLATYGSEIELKGVVAALDTDASTFVIGGLTVDYGSGPAIIDDNISALANDLYVEVKAADYTAGSFTLVATKVELEDDGEIGYQGAESEEFEVNGILTAAYDETSKSFGIGQQVVMVTDTTEYDDVSLSDLADAENIGTLHLEAEGIFNADGVLVAVKVEMEDDGDLEYKGAVTNITVSDTNVGTVTMTLEGTTDEIIVVVNNDTMMKDSSSTEGSSTVSFNLSNWADSSYAGSYVGSYVEIHAYLDTVTGDTIAVKLEKDDAPAP